MRGRKILIRWLTINWNYFKPALWTESTRYRCSIISNGNRVAWDSAARSKPPQHGVYFFLSSFYKKPNDLPYRRGLQQLFITKETGRKQLCVRVCVERHCEKFPLACRSSWFSSRSNKQPTVCLPVTCAALNAVSFSEQNRRGAV